MTVSRRQFLGAFGVSASFTFAGCDGAFLASLSHKAAGGPFDAPDGDQIDAVTHVLNRLSFGPAPGDYGRVQTLGIDAYIQEQLAPETVEDNACERIVRRFETLRLPPGQLFEYKERFLLDELSRATLLRAVYSRRQLYEVMVQFWTDHFNIDWSKRDCQWLKTADDREVIRAHALGSFPALLRASALSPAMLWYLDGRVNHASHKGERPNENYARELLELHTLGVDGGYTQEDVMEAARCLTGWTVKHNTWFGQGAVEFGPKRHDDGAKRVLGVDIPARQGEKDLDALLGIVALHPSTARHIARKLCRHFIADAPPSEAVHAVASSFLDSQGDIRATLRALFHHPAFLELRGGKFKRPHRYVVSALRATAAHTDGHAPLEYLARMGHSPFQYPTPDGYPEEPEPWMGTLFWRWRFAQALAENKLKGTFVDWKALVAEFPSAEATVRHVLGRRPSEEEAAHIAPTPTGAALALASPAFQKF